MNMPAVAQRAASFVGPDNQFFIDKTPLFFRCKFPKWEKHHEVYYRGEGSQGKSRKLPRIAPAHQRLQKVATLVDSAADSFLDKLIGTQSCGAGDNSLH